MSTHSGGVILEATAVKSARPTIKQRSNDAARNLREVLHLSPDASDSIVLYTALAEVVIEENRHNPNPGLEGAIRQRYHELIALPSKTLRAGKKKAQQPPLVPLERPEHEYATQIRLNPFAPPDPAAIIRVYGRAQLARALQDYMLESLKQTAANIERLNPGTKPANRGRKDAVIDYIVKHAGE